MMHPSLPNMHVNFQKLPAVTDHMFHLKLFKFCSAYVQFPSNAPLPANLHQYYLSDAYISHNTKASNLVDHIYKIARNFTLRWKHQLINKYYSGKSKKLLDYGCGTGTFLKSSIEKGWSIAGIEPSPIARDIAANTTGAAIAESLHSLA